MTNDATTAKQYDPGALPGLPSGYRPWPALWALVVGFFMILVDSTIVSVATDAIGIDLTNGTELNGVITYHCDPTADLYVRVDNITDDEYSTVAGYPHDGTQVYAGVVKRF